MEPLVIFSLIMVFWCGRIVFRDFIHDMAECLPQRREKKPVPAPVPVKRVARPKRPAVPVQRLCFQSPVEKMAGLNIG